MSDSLANVKQPLRQLRRRLRTAYVTRFHSFSPAEFRQSLRGLGVSKGDVLCVHSSFDQFLGFRGHVGDALDSLKESVGADGGLLMPSQPFKGSAISFARSGQPTDLRRMPSYMGFLTEILRRTKGAVRSINPTHPVAAWGAAGVALVKDDWKAATPCGRGTAYYRLLDSDARILMLGTGIQPMTFYHCVEELIEPLMPVSPFTTETFSMQTRDVDGQIHSSTMRLYEPGLSARRRMRLLLPDLEKSNSWRESRIGRLQILYFSARDVLDSCRAMAERSEFCYLPEERSGAATRHTKKDKSMELDNQDE